MFLFPGLGRESLGFGSLIVFEPFEYKVGKIFMEKLNP